MESEFFTSFFMSSLFMESLDMSDFMSFDFMSLDFMSFFMSLFISVLVGMFDDELPEPWPSLLQAATPNTAQADRVMAARRFMMVPSLS